MTSYVLFAVLGLGAGAVYGILGIGLVVKNKSSGVIDFSHGAVAMFCAYVYLGLRNSSTLQLPWPVLPHALSLGSGPMPLAVAAGGTCAYAAVLGLVLYVLVYRPLARAAGLTRVCASVGIMLALQAVAVLNFGTESQTAPTILPSGSVLVLGITVPLDRLWFAALVAVLAGVLGAIYRYTRFGMATRAVAQSTVGASISGLSPSRVAAANWALASVLAAVAGILISPISSLDPSKYTLFIIPALGVALVARFSSFTVTVIGGLLLGALQSETTKLLTVWSWLPKQGLVEGLPLVLIILAMALGTRRLAARDVDATDSLPSVGRPERPALAAAVVLVAGVAALAALHGSLRVALMSSLGTACIALSVVLLTGFLGQVSLAQMSFAGFSAFVLTHLTQSWLPFPVPILLAGLAAVPLGLLVGLPALRVRGVNLAIVTLAAAWALDALLFSNSGFTGGAGGRKAPPITLGGLDLSISHGAAYPRVVFGIVCLVVLVLLGLGLVRLRSSATGRALLAVRSNERAAAASGIDVARLKLLTFGTSSFIAGVGGCLLAYQQGVVSPDQFSAFTSLGLLAVVYVAGVGRIVGAGIAGVLLSSTGLMITAVEKFFGLGAYQAVIAGVALVLTAVANPDGIAAALPGLPHRRARTAPAHDPPIPPEPEPAAPSAPAAGQLAGGRS